RKLSGLPPRARPQHDQLLCRWPVPDSVWLLHVLPAAGQLDAHLDERWARAVPRSDPFAPPRVLERPLIRFQLHLVALDRWGAGWERGRGQAGRGEKKHFHPKGIPRLVGFRYPPQHQRQFPLRAALCPLAHRALAEARAEWLAAFERGPV